MTMIASVLNKGAPVLLGDLLLSSTEKPKEFILPSLGGDVLHYLSDSSTYHPVWLGQKIYILKSNLSIAFSGTVFYIRQFLEDFRLFCNIHEEVTVENLTNFLEQHQSDEGWKHMSFVILLAKMENSDLNLGVFKHGSWMRAYANVFGEVWTSGSGSISFLEETLINAEINTRYAMNDVHYAMQMNVIMICRLLARERASQHTIKDHWGAGFEMVYFGGGQFNKVNEITYVISQGRLDAEGHIEVPVPTVILHYQYYEDLLVITAISPFKGQTETTDTHYIIRSTDFHFRQFVVAPLDYRDFGQNEPLPNPSFKSSHNAMGYILDTETGYHVPASFNIGPELTVEYDHPGIVTITMMKEINDRIITQSKTTLFPE